MRTLVRTLRLTSVYCADNRRSVKTVERLGFSEMLPVHEERRLRNIHVPKWVGRTECELVTDPEWADFFTRPLTLEPENGDSFLSVVSRVDEFLASIPSGETPVIVSHTTPLQILLFRLTNLPLDRLWAVEFFHNTYTVINDGTLSHFNIGLESLPAGLGQQYRID